MAKTINKKSTGKIKPDSPAGPLKTRVNQVKDTVALEIKKASIAVRRELQKLAG